MSTSKLISGAVTVLALVALGLAGYKLHARHEVQAALTTADQERIRLVGRTRELEQRVRSEEKNVADLQTTLQAAQAKAVATAEAAKPAPPWNENEAGKAFQQRHPEVTRALIEWRDADLTGKYGKLWRARGLTTEQIAEFKSLFSGALQRRHITDDQKFGWFFAGESLGSAERTRRLQALLGEEGFREFVKINQMRGVSTYPFELARGLSFTDTPLTPQQANELVQVVADASRRVVDWDTIDRKANELLTTEQRRIWKNLSALARAQQELTLATRAAQQNTSQK